MSTNYYDILGIDKNASADEIKKAYRKKAMENHPDRHAGDKSKEEMFKKVNEAYQVLSDPQKKSNYDQFGTAEPGMGGAGFGGFQDFGDIFESFFGGASRGGRRSSGIRGEDIEVTISLELKDIFEEKKEKITFKKKKKCTTCNGSGAKAGTEPTTCGTCNGQGQIKKQTQSIFGYMEQIVTCPECHGSGKIIKEKCEVCHGKKRETEQITKEITIPAGIDDNMTIKIASEGHEWVDAPNGDLYITFSVKREKNGLKRSGNDLIYTVDIDPIEATLGAQRDIKIPILWEKTLEIKPATQHGTILTFKNEGVPLLGKETKGVLKVLLNIVVPKRISTKERELYEQIAKEKKLNVANKKGLFGKIFG